MKPRYIYIIVAVAAAGLAAWIWQTARPNGPTVSVKIPQLSDAAIRGKAVFDANCASCHGVNAAGTDKGPPFIHDFYNPGHHDDEAFFLAARRGVPQHHWRFGNMPAQPQVTRDQLVLLVRYVRELQAANGIGYSVHRM